MSYSIRCDACSREIDGNAGAGLIVTTFNPLTGIARETVTLHACNALCAAVALRERLEETKPVTNPKPGATS